jgi:hypothetical protein
LVDVETLPGNGAATRPDCDFLVMFVAASPQLPFEPHPVIAVTEAAIPGFILAVRSKRAAGIRSAPWPKPARLAERLQAPALSVSFHCWRNVMKFGSLARSAALAVAAVGILVEVAVPASAANYAYMSCYNLWYARNSIYAQQGYCFKTQAAIQTFGYGCFPPYGKLTKWQANQVSQIQYWERRKGCT